MGYIVAWLAQVLALSAACVGIIPALSLILASSWLFITIANDDLTQTLIAFNANVRKSNKQGHDELMQRFCDIIQSYSDVKE